MSAAPKVRLAERVAAGLRAPDAPALRLALSGQRGRMSAAPKVRLAERVAARLRAPDMRALHEALLVQRGRE